MSSFTVDKIKNFTSDKKQFSVDTSIYLDFSECTISGHPHDKRDFKELLSTLSSFQSLKKLNTRNKHELTKKDKGSESDRISSFIDKYTHVWSIDVYQRNSTKGNIRLLYYTDTDDIKIAHVLDCFIDTH